MPYIFVAVGFVLLLTGGDALVRGAVSLAQRLRVSTLIISMTVVAFGTSAPEFVISINAALSGAPTLALGNAVGSNIANVLLIIGLPALLIPMTCAERGIRVNAFLMLMVTGVFILFCFSGELNFGHGFMLFALLIAFLVYWSRHARPASLVIQSNPPDPGAVQEHTDNTPGVLACDESADATVTIPPQAIPRLPQILLLVIYGLIALAIGAHILVSGAVDIARQMNVSEAVIGLTLVALGTSLPELAAVFAAAKQGHGNVAVGNVIGSNFFNLLGVMGVTAMITTVPVPPNFLRFDLWVMLASSALILPFTFNTIGLGKTAGLLFLIAYAVYLIAVVSGQSGVSPGNL